MVDDSVKRVLEEDLVVRLKSNPEVLDDLGGTIEFDIEGKGGGVWTLDSKTKELLKMGSNGKADVAISINECDFLDLVGGKLNPMKAFITGRLKVKGNIQLVMKLSKIFS